jgi:hypothetical protein
MAIVEGFGDRRYELAEHRVPLVSVRAARVVLHIRRALRDER